MLKEFEIWNWSVSDDQADGSLGIDFQKLGLSDFTFSRLDFVEGGEALAGWEDD